MRDQRCVGTEIRTERSSQRTKAKSCNTFGSIDPWLVTTHETADPQNPPMWLTVNRRSYQNGSTQLIICGLSFWSRIRRSS
ncbi:fumarylacetoacetate hydrolase family protein [Microvirga massiliensis]|uniref:fumarylacetoacetate hydrolase family protein n=1 Tax=Microvirga massiliensis TaxID=1033741 RepID=UPI00093D4D75